jgi:bifunctional non-homologous end joining protein LigD
MSARNYKAMGEKKLRLTYQTIDDQPPEDRDVIVSLAYAKLPELKDESQPLVIGVATKAAPATVALPKDWLKPMLAFDAGRPVVVPQGGDWVLEPKYDGIRLMVHMTENGVRAYGGRNGREHTGNQPKQEHVLAQMPVDTIVDGELVHGAGKRLDYEGEQGELMFVVFDVLRLAGVDVRSRPQAERRQLLEKLAEVVFDGVHVQMTPQLPCRQEVYENLVEMGWEGAIAKAQDGTYRPGKRSREMLKLKPQWSSEATVIGFVMGKGDSNGHRVGALQIRMLDTGAETSVGYDCEVGEVYELVGRTCEVNHNGIWEATGKPRHPGWSRWRPDRD